MAEPSLFEELGGAPVLERVIDRFVDRVFDDTMIGYLFRNASRTRIKQKEFEHAAEYLGGPVAYTGRPLGSVHRPHRIRGGQFMRRLRILEETLDELGVPPRVKEHWLRHTRALQTEITADADGVCDSELPATPRRPLGA